ncbi:class II aldolase/adducin family protein [Devosia indica]
MPRVAVAGKKSRFDPLKRNGRCCTERQKRCLWTARHHCVLLANHGPVVAGSSLEDAVHTVEELEASARLYLLLKDQDYRPLDAEQVSRLEAKFPAKS